jgi:hypothetical protein
MLVIREETLRDVGQVRMINLAAAERHNEAFMVRILDPSPWRVQPASPATVSTSTPPSGPRARETTGIGDPACSPRSSQAVLLRPETRQAHKTNSFSQLHPPSPGARF